jgi:hypothetical protein
MEAYFVPELFESGSIPISSEFRRLIVKSGDFSLNHSFEIFKGTIFSEEDFYMRPLAIWKCITNELRTVVRNNREEPHYNLRAKKNSGNIATFDFDFKWKQHDWKKYNLGELNEDVLLIILKFLGPNKNFMMASKYCNYIMRREKINKLEKMAKFLLSYYKFSYYSILDTSQSVAQDEIRTVFYRYYTGYLRLDRIASLIRAACREGEILRELINDIPLVLTLTLDPITKEERMGNILFFYNKFQYQLATQDDLDIFVSLGSNFFRAYDRDRYDRLLSSFCNVEDLDEAAYERRREVNHRELD